MKKIGTAFKGNFIDGKFVMPEDGAVFVSEDPGDLDHPVGEAFGAAEAVAEAAAAARAAFPAWRDLSREKRTAFLRRYQKAVEKRRALLGSTISRETGKTAKEADDEVTAMVEKVDVTVAEALPLVAGKSFALKNGAGVIRYAPRGVVGVIGPFNVPGHLPNGQIVPALLTGNTVVFKPSPLAPFVGQVVAECFEEAALPAGVFNLVQGAGDVGAAMAAQAGIDLLFFTGSVAVGQRVKALGDEVPGRVTALELGGKNAALVLADAPLEAAIDQIVHGAFATTGQRCSSTSRVFVHRSQARRFMKDFMAKVGALKTGYFSDDVFMGPLISRRAVENFLEAQRAADELGFATVQRGESALSEKRGHYVRPSVHVWEGFPSALLLNPRRYWDEELFAPDVAVYVLDSDDEMVALNNASQFGLAASVFTADRSRFHALAPRLQNGVVHWNRSTAMTPGRLPFGGVKASGNGWPAGLFAVHACVVPVGSVESPP